MFLGIERRTSTKILIQNQAQGICQTVFVRRGQRGRGIDRGEDAPFRLGGGIDNSLPSLGMLMRLDELSVQFSVRELIPRTPPHAAYCNS